jgi:hypothetical protein
VTRPATGLRMISGLPDRLGRSCSGLLQLSQSVPHDGYCALQRKHSHNRSNDGIRPTGAGAKHAKRSQQHSQIAQHIIARANSG